MPNKRGANPKGAGKGSNQNQSKQTKQNKASGVSPAKPPSKKGLQRGQDKTDPDVKEKRPLSKPTAPPGKGSGSKAKDEKKAKGSQPIDRSEVEKQELQHILKLETQEKEEAQKKRKVLEDENKSLQEKLNNETKEKQKVEVRYRKAEDEKVELEKEKHELSGKLTEEQTNHGNLKRKYETLKDEKLKLEKEKHELSDKLTEEQTNHGNLKRKYETLKDEKLKLDKEKHELSGKLTEEQTNSGNLKRKYETLKEENQSLKREKEKVESRYRKAEVEKLTIQEKYKDLKQKYWELNDKYEALTQEGASRSKVPRMQDVWIIPRALHEDDRVLPILKQVLDAIDRNIGLQAMEPEHITTKHQGRVLVPLVAASRLGSDVQAAYEKAKLGNVPAIMLIFHHLAPHNSKITTKTKDRLSDRELVERSQDMIDLVFWNGAMYDCAANHNALTQLKAIAKETFN